MKRIEVVENERAGCSAVCCSHNKFFFGYRVAPTRHLGANKGYASKKKYFSINNHTLLSTRKCRVGDLCLLSLSILHRPRSRLFPSASDSSDRLAL
jgi:hypothetical protein